MQRLWTGVDEGRAALDKCGRRRVFIVSMNSDSNHIIKTMSWGVLWRALRYPFLLASLLVVPRLMGDLVYGRFAVFLSIYMMSESFTGLGNLQIFGRFLPEHEPHEHERSSHFLHGMLYYGLIITLIIAVLASGLVLLFRGDDFPRRWIVILVLILALGKIQGTLFSFLYGRNEIGRFSFCALARSICRFVFVVVLYLLYGLDGALWAFVLNELTLACLAAYWARGHLFSSWRRPRFSDFLPYLRFGMFFYAPIFLLGLLQRSGNVLITALFEGGGSEVYRQVAHFDLANQFLLLTVSFFAIFLITLVPSLTKLHISEQHAKIRDWLSIALTYCALLGLLAVNALACFGRPVLSLLGEGFSGAYDNALIMSIAIFPLIVAHVGSNVAVVEKEPRANMISTAIGLMIMITLFVLLVPRWGALGASWGSVGGYLAYGGVFIIHYRRLFFRILGKMMLVAAVGSACIPLYLRMPDLPAGLIWFGAITGGQLLLLWALRVIDMKRLRQLMSALRPGEV